MYVHDKKSIFKTWHITYQGNIQAYRLQLSSHYHQNTIKLTYSFFKEYSFDSNFFVFKMAFGRKQNSLSGYFPLCTTSSLLRLWLHVTKRTFSPAATHPRRCKLVFARCWYQTNINVTWLACEFWSRAGAPNYGPRAKSSRKAILSVRKDNLSRMKK